MFRFTKLSGLAAIAVGVAGCGGTNASSVGSPSYGGELLSPEQRQQVVTDATKALTHGTAQSLTTGINTFGFDLFRKVAAGNGKANVAISPTSVSNVLAMLYNGAAGPTQKQIGQLLGAAKLKPEEVNDAAKNLNALLANVDPDKVTLTVSNSLWVNAGVPLSTDFVQKNSSSLGAKVSTLDFSSQTATKTINDWVKDNTNGKIPTIVDKLSGDARLFVVNAVYFKGKWAHPFKTENTHDGDFTLMDGTKAQVPMMSQTASFGYFTNGDVNGLTMPYGSGRLEMDVLLPSGKNDVASIVKKLNTGSWDNWMKSAQAQEVQVTMPKFTSSFQADLNESLKAVGLSDAFDPAKANFSAIETKDSPTAKAERLYLSDVKHKVFIDVNEEGTEAAAATGAVVKATAVRLPMKFTADRPFLYAIRDTQTGSILFLGTVADPTAKAEEPTPKDAPKTK